MPMYSTKPGERKHVTAKVDTKQGNSNKIVKAGHKGYALCLRIDDQMVTVKWSRIAGFGSVHPVADIEFAD